MADETGKSDVLNPYGLNPNSGKPMPWARESLAVSLLPNVTQARLYTCWAPGHEPDWAKPRQPEMRAWDPAEDERRRAAANNLGILFLGPVFGAPAALARMAGAPEPVVESMGQVGLDLAGVAGVPGVRGGGRIYANNSRLEAPALIIKTHLGRNGVSVQRKGLSPSQEKSIRSYRKRIQEHEKKIKDFKESPTIRPGMENQPAEVIAAQHQRRIMHLEREIKAFESNIQKIINQSN